MRQRDPLIWMIAIFCFWTSAAASAATWTLPPAVMGLIPIPTVAMAFAGTSLGLIWQPPVSGGRVTMLALTVCFTFFVSCVVIILPHVPGFLWAKDIQPPIAGAASFLAQKLVPALSRGIENKLSGRGATDQGVPP